MTGAAGGSGATTVAFNLAYEIAEKLGQPTILAELTLQMGTLASMLDLQPKFTLPHLIRENPPHRRFSGRKDPGQRHRTTEDSRRSARAELDPFGRC